MSLALADHSSLEDVVLEGVVDDDAQVWLYADGADMFVPLDLILDVWERTAVF